MTFPRLPGPHKTCNDVSPDKSHLFCCSLKQQKPIVFQKYTGTQQRYRTNVPWRQNPRFQIYVYLKPWILSSRNICLVPLLCAGIFLKDSLLHVWLNATLQYYLWHDLCLYYSALDLLLTRRLHYWVLHDVNYIHRACSPGTWYFMRVCVVFLRDVMTFTYYVLSRNFIFMYVMPYISIWCQLYLHNTRCPGTWYFMPDSVVYFYVMSLILIYCELSRNLIFYARQCCIFLRDVIGVHLLWALGELEIYVRQCHLSTTWFHHTLRLSREIYMLYWCCLYINTLFNIAVLYYVEWRCIFPSWIFTRNVYILTNMVLSFFDDRLVSDSYIWMWTCLSANGNWMKRV